VQLEGLVELEEPDGLIILDPEVLLASAGPQNPACRHCLAGTDEWMGDPIGSIRDDVDARSAREGELEIARWLTFCAVPDASNTFCGGASLRLWSRLGLANEIGPAKVSRMQVIWMSGASPSARRGEGGSSSLTVSSSDQERACSALAVCSVCRGFCWRLSSLSSLMRKRPWS
jgi:hypothetical protein